MLKVLEYLNVDYKMISERNKYLYQRIFRLLFAKRPRRFRYRGVRGLDGDI